MISTVNFVDKSQLIFDLPADSRAAAISEAQNKAQGGEYRGLLHRRPRCGGIQVAWKGRYENGRLTMNLGLYSICHYDENGRVFCAIYLLHPFIHSRNCNIHLGHNQITPRRDAKLKPACRVLLHPHPWQRPWQHFKIAHKQARNTHDLMITRKESNPTITTVYNRLILHSIVQIIVRHDDISLLCTT